MSIESTGTVNPVRTSTLKGMEELPFIVTIDPFRCGELYSEAGVNADVIGNHTVEFSSADCQDPELGVNAGHYTHSQLKATIHPNVYWKQSETIYGWAMRYAGVKKSRILGHVSSGPLIYTVDDESPKTKDERVTFMKHMRSHAGLLLDGAELEQFEELSSDKTEVHAVKPLLLGGVNKSLRGVIAREARHAANADNMLTAGLRPRVLTFAEKYKIWISMGAGVLAHNLQSFVDFESLWLTLGLTLGTYQFLEDGIGQLSYKLDPDEISARRFAKGIRNNPVWNDLASIRPREPLLLGAG